MSGGSSLTESPSDPFRSPFSALKLLQQLRGRRAGNFKLLGRKPARLLRKAGDVELSVGGKLVCGDAPFFGNGVEQRLALLGGNILPSWHDVNETKAIERFCGWRTHAGSCVLLAAVDQRRPVSHLWGAIGFRRSSPESRRAQVEACRTSSPLHREEEGGARRPSGKIKTSTLIGECAKWSGGVQVGCTLFRPLVVSKLRQCCRLGKCFAAPSSILGRLCLRPASAVLSGRGGLGRRSAESRPGWRCGLPRNRGLLRTHGGISCPRPQRGVAKEVERPFSLPFSRHPPTRLMKFPNRAQKAKA